MTNLLALSKALIALGCIPQDLGHAENDNSFRSYFSDVYKGGMGGHRAYRSPATRKLGDAIDALEFAKKDVEEAKRGVECEDKFREFKALVKKLEGEK